MIREWRLGQFKSVVQPTSLEMRPLTVFAGGNSSGKSTIVHSLLLMYQTLASRSSHRQLALNGEILTLGTFSDVLSQSSERRVITLGFTLDVDISPEQRRKSVPVIGAASSSWYRGKGTLKGQVYADFEFAPASDDKDGPKSLSLQGQLSNAFFKAVVGNTKIDLDKFGFNNTPQTLEVRRRNDEEVVVIVQSVEAATEGFDARSDASSLEFMVGDKSDSTNWKWRQMQESRAPDGSEVIAVHLDHFLPRLFVNRYSTARREIIRLVNELQRSLAQGIDGDNWAKASELHKLVLETIDSQRGERDRLTFVNGLRPDTSLRDVVDGVVDQLDNEHRQKRAIEFVAPPDFVQLLSEVVINLFKNVLYLGPLRDEPKPIYSVANPSDPAYVGAKGEYTAAVLDLYGDQEVDYVSPDDPQSVSRATLRDATTAWLAHFGMVERFHTRDEGKMGHLLHVSPGGLASDVDLTNVGVGVSQVLPIVVMALVSPRQSILLFEQPELHLHPKVQSLLADFFLAVTKTGRQCIIESHSEYLINRLRLRVAEEPWESDLNKSIGIFFVERPEGGSEFQPVEINEYGAIPDWPDGFFDEGPAESDRILAAVAKKRKSRPGGNKLQP
jgi:predicted ATPase